MTTCVRQQFFYFILVIDKKLKDIAELIRNQVITAQWLARGLATGEVLVSYHSKEKTSDLIKV